MSVLPRVYSCCRGEERVATAAAAAAAGIGYSRSASPHSLTIAAEPVHRGQWL